MLAIHNIIPNYIPRDVHMPSWLCVPSVDYNGPQSAIRRPRTPSDQSLLLCMDIVTEKKNWGRGIG